MLLYYGSTFRRVIVGFVGLTVSMPGVRTRDSEFPPPLAADTGRIMVSWAVRFASQARRGMPARAIENQSRDNRGGDPSADFRHDRSRRMGDERLGRSAEVTR
jgi:hypothetical protein